jgi:hypothetical protein
MARFGRDLVKSLANPLYAGQVATAGMLLGGMPGRIEEEEKRQERMQRETSAFEIYNQALRSSEDANVAGVTSSAGKLSGMLTEETDETLRSDLMQKITALGNLQTSTQAKKDIRNVEDLVKAEALLEQLNEKGDARTSNEDTIMEGVQQRVDQLRQDGSIVQGANALKRQRRLASLQQSETLAVAEANAMKRDLAQHPVGSKNFNDRVAFYRSKGLGVEADRLQNDLMTIQTDRQDLQDKLDQRAPLTPAEKKIITDLGFKVTGDVKADRKTLNTIQETKFQKQLNIALRQLDPASAGLAKATVIDTLSELVREGEIEQLPIAQDLSDKVEDMLSDPDELELFMGRVEGASPAEIENIVIGYIKERFPEDFAEMQTEIRRKATIQSTKQSALADIAVSTNAARGTAAFEAGQIDEDRPLTPDDEGYFDLANPDDADRALVLYEREENKKRKASQKEEQLRQDPYASRSSFNLGR